MGWNDSHKINDDHVNNRYDNFKGFSDVKPFNTSKYRNDKNITQ